MKQIVPIVLLFQVILLASSGAPVARADQRLSDELTDFAKGQLLEISGLSKGPPAPASALKTQKACFVTYYSGKKVFACFGSFTPRTANLAEEIAQNTRLALKNDLRARVATQRDMLDCRVQITFPEQPVKIKDWRIVDPSREGLLVETPEGKGVAIVPGEAKTASWAFRSAMKRLGLNENSREVTIYRFKATFLRSR